MRVLGVGLNKTGTTSLQHAFRILAFKTEGCTGGYDRLRDVLDGSNTQPDFRRFDDIDAIFDLPTAYFYDEIMHAYPGIKCILTIRDEDRWWKSIEKHFNERTPTQSEEQDPSRWQWRTYVYGSATASEFLYRKKYREHNERVVHSIPADRLLTMDIEAGDGWAELCPFLGVPVPDLPFPHQNVGSTDAERTRREAISDVTKLVSPRRKFILIDEGWLGGDLPEEMGAIPFLEKDGRYWGKPADDEVAIRELERLRREGTSYIVFAEPAFWWLDHYAGLYHHLSNHYRCVLNNDFVIGFDLASDDPAPGGG